MRPWPAVIAALLIFVLGCDPGSAAVRLDSTIARVKSGVPAAVRGFHYTLDVARADGQPELSDLLSVVWLSEGHANGITDVVAAAEPSSAGPRILQLGISRRFASARQAYDLAGVTIGSLPAKVRSLFMSASSRSMQPGYYLVLVRMTVPMGSLSSWTLRSLTFRLSVAGGVRSVRVPGSLSLKRTKATTA